jgi:N-acetylglucosaminyldiphosphoundecaprenol N-acetyl-beta-D-mannosaminyltransferase
VQPINRANVLGIGVHTVDLQGAASILEAQIREKQKGYVCLAGVHGIMEAQRSRHLRSIFAEATLVAPDGMPLVWISHLQGFAATQRVFGPDLMADIMGRVEFRNCVHFLCGGEDGVADKLQKEMLRRFPRIKIAGTYSPPFRSMTEVEEREFVASVRKSRPDIIWVGISTPKQERFMAHYLPMLNTTLMVGVGAAFLFHTDAIQDSPKWVKRAGMQWLHRFFQEPTRLWKRYLRNNPLFIIYALLQIVGWKRYPLEKGSLPSRSKSAVPIECTRGNAASR